MTNLCKNWYVKPIGRIGDLLEKDKQESYVVWDRDADYSSLQ